MADTVLMNGQVIDHSYNPGYIVLSYVVSFIGSASPPHFSSWMVQLVSRPVIDGDTKVSKNHLLTKHPRYLLIGAGISMGAVAIWSMHYVGNRAIEMLSGGRGLQIRYNAASTAGSFFLAIGVVSIAFYFLGLADEVHISLILVVGCLTGAAVCGMHYLGQNGISNYVVSYDWKYVVGAAFIAVIAATVALGVFFYFKTTWTNSWYKRALCASVLAGAVSGMHWCATVGTIYRYRVVPNDHGPLSRQATVIIVLCLSITSCATLIFFAVYGQRMKAQAAHRAQQVVLASVVFDRDGRLLVTPDGKLPSRKIVKTYVEQNLEVFNVEHPVFTWMYRASHCWASVVELIPQMRTNLQAAKRSQSTRPGTANSASEGMTINGTEDLDFAVAFKEHFCYAASGLAEWLQEPLEQLGVLFPAIMFTGTFNKPRRFPFLCSARTAKRSVDTERDSGLPNFGRGQLLFLIRQADGRDAARLQAAGFNFARPTNILSSLAQSLEVQDWELDRYLGRIKKSLSRSSMLDPGVHLACFTLRPKYHGWDILVNQKRKNLLPSVELFEEKLHPQHMQLFINMNGLSPSECDRRIKDRMEVTQDKKERLYLVRLRVAIRDLAAQVGASLFEGARLLARPFRMPCQCVSESTHHREATLIMFRMMVDVHYSGPVSASAEFAPARLFLAQQHVYPGMPDHGAFARQVHQEFANLAEGAAKSPASSTSSERLNSRRSSDVSNMTALDRKIDGKTGASHENLPASGLSRARTAVVKFGHRKQEQARKVQAKFGGIHVQHDVSVSISEIEDAQDTEYGIEMGHLGVHSEASVAMKDIETYADQMMTFMLDERRQRLIREFKERNVRDPFLLADQTAPAPAPQ
ncbi:MAG: hypothetical protein Q9174_004914 [Haloplaca sp. 1 TL-2023]